ncbi:MAG: 3-keto-5-aminohexanoate cleavage protein [Rhizobiales bacterium]|nr:3-keto-5-aminohexanoate cleavage protein [Hyphomicrobiales bacterium]
MEDRPGGRRAASERQVAVAVAPNGARRTKADHPALPMTPAELAGAAAECLDTGAAMIHVHVRRSDGLHVLDADAYRSALAAIRAAVGDQLVMQITTEALGLYSPDEQLAVVRDVKPEAVSIALREVVPDSAAEAAFIDFLHWAAREEIVPQVILYTPGEAGRLAELVRRGDLPWEDVPVLFVLGRYAAGQLSQPTDLLPYLADRAPRFRDWMVCAFGRDETACVVAAALLGGDVRVGFENNLWLPDGSVAPSNVASVAATAQALRRCGRALASADDLRLRWGRLMHSGLRETDLATGRASPFPPMPQTG